MPNRDLGSSAGSEEEEEDVVDVDCGCSGGILGRTVREGRGVGDLRISE